VQSLKARYVFPVAGEPIPGGVVTLDRDRIVGVGRAEAPGAAVLDLGNVAILPGMVNAHAHLDLSDVDRPLGEPHMPLPDWIRRVMAFRGAPDRDRQSPRGGEHPVAQGLRESLRFGTTTVADLAQPGWPAEIVRRAPIETAVFLELIAPTRPRVPAAIALARQHLDAAAGWLPGLGPHSPYSVHAELLAEIASLSASRRVPVAFHLAESREELQLLESVAGPLRRLLDDLGAWEEGSIRPAARPLDYLRTLASAWQVLVVHGNYLDDEEIALLSEHAERMAVVFCPRTHAFFGHDRYPLERMLAAGVHMAVGTDSRASAPDLSILAEMRDVARRFPAVALSTVLQMGTLDGARALARDREIGTLEPGKTANLAVVALPDGRAADPHALLFDSSGPVVETWFRGRRVFPE